MNKVRHLAIIMDGNGRWAKQNKLPIKLGHSEGVKALKKIVKESVKQNFKSLTVFAFSSENWRRSSTVSYTHLRAHETG